MKSLKGKTGCIQTAFLTGTVFSRVGFSENIFLKGKKLFGMESWMDDFSSHITAFRFGDRGLYHGLISIFQPLISDLW